MRQFFRRIAKLLAFLVFGLGAVPTGFVVLPLMRLLVHPVWRFQMAGRRFVSGMMRMFVWFMKRVGLVTVQADRTRFKDLHGVIIAPNHPSFLDVVILFSLVPGASCVVRSGLFKTIVGAIVAPLYINNDTFPEAMAEEARRVLEHGDNLIFFPEGTRTKDERHLALKRGAALLSCLTGAPLVPVSILGNDKTGLKKHDKLLRVNPSGPWTYEFEIQKPIVPPSTGNLRTNSRLLQDRLRLVLQNRLDRYDKEHA